LLIIETNIRTETIVPKNVASNINTSTIATTSTAATTSVSNSVPTSLPVPIIARTQMDYEADDDVDEEDFEQADYDYKSDDKDISEHESDVPDTASIYDDESNENIENYGAHRVTVNSTEDILKSPKSNWSAAFASRRNRMTEKMIDVPKPSNIAIATATKTVTRKPVAPYASASIRANQGISSGTTNLNGTNVILQEQKKSKANNSLASGVTKVPIPAVSKTKSNPKTTSKNRPVSLRSAVKAVIASNTSKYNNKPSQRSIPLKQKTTSQPQKKETTTNANDVTFDNASKSSKMVTSSISGKTYPVSILKTSPIASTSHSIDHKITTDLDRLDDDYDVDDDDIMYNDFTNLKNVERPPGILQYGHTVDSNLHEPQRSRSPVSNIVIDDLPGIQKSVKNDSIIYSEAPGWEADHEMDTDHTEYEEDTISDVIVKKKISDAFYSENTIEDDNVDENEFNVNDDMEDADSFERDDVSSDDQVDIKANIDSHKEQQYLAAVPQSSLHIRSGSEVDITNVPATPTSNAILKSSSKRTRSKSPTAVALTSSTSIVSDGNFLLQNPTFVQTIPPTLSKQSYNTLDISSTTPIRLHSVTISSSVAKTKSLQHSVAEPQVHVSPKVVENVSAPSLIRSSSTLVDTSEAIAPWLSASIAWAASKPRPYRQSFAANEETDYDFAIVVRADRFTRRGSIFSCGQAVKVEDNVKMMDKNLSVPQPRDEETATAAAAVVVAAAANPTAMTSQLLHKNSANHLNNDIGASKSSTIDDSASESDSDGPSDSSDDGGGLPRIAHRRVSKISNTVRSSSASIPIHRRRSDSESSSEASISSGGEDDDDDDDPDDDGFVSGSKSNDDSRRQSVGERLFNSISDGLSAIKNGVVAAAGRLSNASSRRRVTWSGNADAVESHVTEKEEKIQPSNNVQQEKINIGATVNSKDSRLASDAFINTAAKHKCGEILDALRGAGLFAKRVRSLSRRTWLLKIGASEERLEIEAERVRLRLRRRDGGWSRFRRSQRDAFVTTWSPLPTIHENIETDDGHSLPDPLSLDTKRPDVEHGGQFPTHGRNEQGKSRPSSLFHSSDRQTLIDHILRTSEREGGAGLGAGTELGSYVTAMFPLHMEARLAELRSDWLALWRPTRSIAAADRIGVVDPTWYAAAPLIDLAAVAAGGSTAVAAAASVAASSDAINSLRLNNVNLTRNTNDTDHDVNTSQKNTGSVNFKYTKEKEDNSDINKSVVEAKNDCCAACCVRCLRSCCPPCISSIIICILSMFCICFAACGKVCRSTYRCCSRPLHQPLDRIAAYFGEAIAFYFAWLQFYTIALTLPAAAGIAIFVAQMNARSLDLPWVPLYSLGVAIWAVVLLEIWKRRNAELAQRWGVLNYEDEEVVRPQFVGSWKMDARTGAVLRVYPMWRRVLAFAVTIPTILIFVSSTVLLMMVVFSTRDQLILRLDVYEAEVSAITAANIAVNSANITDTTRTSLLSMIPTQPDFSWNVLSAISTAWDSGASGFFSGVSNQVLVTSGSNDIVSKAYDVIAAAVNASQVYTGSSNITMILPDSTSTSSSTSVPTSSSGSNILAYLIDAPSVVASEIQSWTALIASHSDWRWWVLMIVPPLVYGLLMAILDTMFSWLTLRANDWENHATESAYRNHRIAKVFTFRFTASFFPLFYYAFSPAYSSLPTLFLQLATYQIAGQLLRRNVLSISSAKCKSAFTECSARRRARVAEDSGLTEGKRGRRLLRHATSTAWVQARMPVYDSFDDYADLLIQYV
jgi:Calcium-activated chloride channel